MKKHPKRSQLLNNLHKGFVLACVAATLYGCSVMGLKYYRYITEIKPNLKQKQLQEEKTLLAEGASDALQDIAPSLKA